MGSSVQIRGAVNQPADSVPPAWSHVCRRLAARYGDEAVPLTRQLIDQEAQRHASRTSSITRIAAPRDVFQRNLRTLEYIAQGKTHATKEAIEQLYRDAVADVQRIFPRKRSGDPDWARLWRHCLEAAKREADLFIL